MDTAGRGIERVDIAALAADEHAPAGDHGLRVSSHVARKTEGPFELQTRHFGCGESGHGAILITRVVHAPAVPERSREQAGEVALPDRTHGLRGRRCHQRLPKRLPGDEFRNGAALRRRAGARHGNHGSRLQRGENPLWRHRPQRLAIRGAIDSNLMARGANLFVERGAVVGGQRRSGEEQQHKRGGARDEFSHFLLLIFDRACQNALLYTRARGCGQILS